MLTLRSSGGEDHAPLQEIETRPPVALPLDQPEPVDLAFGLAAAPGLGQGSPDRGGVTVQSLGEGGDGRSAARPRFRDPRVEIRSARPPPGRLPVHTRGENGLRKKALTHFRCRRVDGSRLLPSEIPPGPRIGVQKGL